MFENLSERLERSFKILKGEGKITEINISEAMKDIRRALLDADVSYKIAKQFCDEVKKKAIGQNVLTAVKPQPQRLCLTEYAHVRSERYVLTFTRRSRIYSLRIIRDIYLMTKSWQDFCLCLTL